MKKTKLNILLTLLISTFFCISGSSKTWYVDSKNTGTHDGTSWNTAWSSPISVSGVAGGDTVYISGGPTGTSQNYTVSGWTPIGGSIGNPITYKIGQDSAHNGFANFSGGGTCFSGGINFVILSGDAGDGLMHFVLSGYQNAINGNTGPVLHDTTFSYINFGNVSGVEPCLFVFSYGIVIDHTWIAMTSSAANICYHFASSRGGAAFASTLIFHHNTVYVPSLNGWDNVTSGPDCIQCGGNGFQIYNNRFFASSPLLGLMSGGQHQDMIQAIQCSYVQIYNNLLWGSRVDSCYLENTGTEQEQYVFNNIMSSAGGGQDGNTGNNTRICSLNNLFVDFTKSSVGNYGVNMPAGGTWSDCWYGNSARFNINGGDSISSSINQFANVTIPNSSYFKNYIQNSTNSDYHITSLAVNLIGKGNNLTSFVASHPGAAALLYDMDGNPRPTTGPWDIGPYNLSNNTTNIVLFPPNNLKIISIK